MDFTVFSVNSTNIFPLANDKANSGQLMTELNLRTRESVGTDSDVQYFIGPSYTHSVDDFYVDMQRDSTGSIVSSSTLMISRGRAVVNGHYIESMVDVTIDLLDYNARALLNGEDTLSGRLAVGLRALYSTESTMAGAMIADNKDAFYEGIKVVVLPEEEFKIPSDVPYEQDKVTAHLKLATFNFINGSINTVETYEYKTSYVEGNRIKNIDELLSSTYVSKAGLNPKKLYTFSGKGRDEISGYDTWCDSTDSLMIWDSDPTLTTERPSLKEASFGTTTSGITQLALPHKQVDGMTNTGGDPEYYKGKTYDLPLADFNKGTAGTVNKAYTDCVKEITNQIHNIYELISGKQVGFIDILESRMDLPPINRNWENGDYILVRLDYTLDTSGDDVRPPATLYVVLPGSVKSYRFYSEVIGGSDPLLNLDGIQLGSADMYESNGDTVNTEDPDIYLTYFDLYSNIRGVVNEDYFVIHYYLEDGSVNTYVYVVSEVGDREYSDPIWVTGEIPLARTDVIGGFYNVEDTDLDNGYVYLDSSGHLVLLDYSLLRSGTLAYQLGEDVIISSGLTSTEIQGYLDDYVNNRVAFPNSSQLSNSKTPNIINVTINLTDEGGDSEINIYNIDSRFNTSVCINITGNAESSYVVNIIDCEKIRVNKSIEGNPTINIYRSCIYYDASILDLAGYIENMTLWYEKYEDTDPDLIVNNMTVRDCGSPIIPNDLDYWDDDVLNDNHFSYALQSITFGPDGYIVGASMYVRNNTTANVSEGHCIISDTFELPQGSGLEYPVTRMTKQVKFTGSFTNAYATTSPLGYMVIDTNFSATTASYNEYTGDIYIQGSIAFHVVATLVTNIVGLEAGTPLDCWESGAYHVFQGSTI